MRLMVSEKILKSLSLYKSMKSLDTLGVASLDPWGLFSRILCRGPLDIATYKPLGLREDF